MFVAGLSREMGVANRGVMWGSCGIAVVTGTSRYRCSMRARTLGRIGPCAELLSKVDGAVKSCWPMACLYRSLRFGEEYLPVSALLVDKA